MFGKTKVGTHGKFELAIIIFWKADTLKKMWVKLENLRTEITVQKRGSFLMAVKPKWSHISMSHHRSLGLA